MQLMTAMKFLVYNAEVWNAL